MQQTPIQTTPTLMPNTSDLKFDENGINIQAVLMGISGVGKTWLAGTFPRPNFFDFDQKIGVLRNPDFMKKYGDVKAEYEVFADTKRIKGFAVSHNAYDAACYYFDKWMTPSLRNKFDTWVIDSGTSLSEVARNKGLIVLGEMKRSYTFGKAQSTGLAALEQQDFGAERSLVEQFIRMVRNSGKHVLVLVHQKETYDTNGNLVSVKPLFTGQSSEVVMAMFKDVWHLKLQGLGPTLKRVLTAEYNGIYSTRSELGLGTIEDPDYLKIIARIRERQQAAQLAPTPTGVTQGTTLPAQQPVAPSR